jgi:hypothetical protein
VVLAVMFQSWCDITFVHWRFPADAIRAHVPRPLEVDTFDGSAWIGITPFVLRDLRPALLPAIPWISTFPETNCRTYVKAPDGSSGVWFFSLDAARAAAVAGARLAYGLPYGWSRMRVVSEGRRIRYESRRVWPDSRAATAIAVTHAGAIEPRDLEIFLTARFRLYSLVLGRLTYTDVEHAPWPLRSAEVHLAYQTLTAAAGLPEPTGAPVVHFSPGVRVRVGRPKAL